MSVQITSDTDAEVARPSLLATFEKHLNTALDWVLGAAFLVELAIMFGNVVNRGLTGKSWIWSQETGQLAVAVIAFIGGATAYARGEHMAMHAVVNRLPKSWTPYIEAIGHWLLLVMAIVTGYFSLIVLRTRIDETFVTIPVSQAWFILPLFVSMILFAIFAAQRLYLQPRKVVVRTAVALAALVALFILTEATLDFPGENSVVGFMFGLFALLLILGVPIGFVLPTCALVYLYYSGDAPFEAVPQAMFGGVTSIVLLAIPFFILAGIVMTEGGISRRLAELIVSIVGHFRGGLLQVAVICMYVVSGLSGSKMADLSAVGLTMKDMLKRHGYDPAESTAVFAASTVMGETIPPSIIMLILASITSLSVGSLFLAGILPAAFIAACLMVAIYIRARRHNMPSGKKASLATMTRAVVTALPSLSIPVFLIGGIVGGFSTATEASSTAVIYAVLLAWLGYKEVNLRSLWRMVIAASVKSGMILFICSAAFAFSWSLTVANVPHAMGDLLISVAHRPWLFMLGSVATLVFMGAMLEGVPAIMIFGPLLLPIAHQFGIDTLQYGIVLIISMGLGTFLPGIGIGMYVACSVGGVTMDEVTPRMVPYLGVLILGLLLVAYIPSISLILPQLFMKG
jgi:tripartite ATP-independent transporter DctM subunit